MRQLSIKFRWPRFRNRPAFSISSMSLAKCSLDSWAAGGPRWKAVVEKKYEKVGSRFVIVC